PHSRSLSLPATATTPLYTLSLHDALPIFQLARSAKPLLGGVLDVAQTLRRHILNAVRRENNYGLSFGKESKDSPKKVDGYAALMAAHEAEHDYHERGSKAPKKKRAGQVRFY